MDKDKDKDKDIKGVWGKIKNSIKTGRNKIE
jgi:hypothetical protein